MLYDQEFNQNNNKVFSLLKGRYINQKVKKRKQKIPAKEILKNDFTDTISTNLLENNFKTTNKPDFEKIEYKDVY